MRKTLFAIVAAAVLALPAACVHPHYGRHGGPGGPGSCPKHQQCGCKQQAECKCPDCACKKDGACTCGHKEGGPQQPHQHEQAPPAAK